MKLIANENFQYRGTKKTGDVLIVSHFILEAEIKKGKHTQMKNGRYPWLSGLIEHCSPADKTTKQFFSKATGTDYETEDLEDVEDDVADIKNMWAEFETLGKAYDRRWGVKRLQNELRKAKVLTGLPIEPKSTVEVIKD